MQPIIYDVAVSIDGYIAGRNGDISAFPAGGKVVRDYQERLQGYSCAIMGRKTYEFGYDFGLTPGANPYAHMDCLVFSQQLELPQESSVRVIKDPLRETVLEQKRTQAGPIYLCGGGQFAGSLLSLGLIDVLRLKRTPIVLGGGTPLFEGDIPDVSLSCTTVEAYEDGSIFQELSVLSKDNQTP